MVEFTGKKYENGKPTLDYRKVLAAKQRAYRLANRDKINTNAWKSHLLRRYGITQEQYKELLERQNNSCFICRKHESTEKFRLAVDHDHKTGEIRGLLCNFCNSRLVGRHRDPEKFFRAAEYLQQGTGWFVPTQKRKRRRK